MKRYLIVILFFLLVPKAYSQEIEYLDFWENANYTCETASSEQAKPHRLLANVAERYLLLMMEVCQIL